MKSLILTAILVTSSAYASCPELNLEGVYSNGNGNKFRIEQSNCDSAVLTDLQLNKRFEINLDGTLNALDTSNVINVRGIGSKLQVKYSATRVPNSLGGAIKVRAC